MYLIPASSVHRNRWKVTSLSSSIWFWQTDKGAFYHNFTAEVSVAACCFQQETIVFYFQRSLKCITIEDSIFANISSNKIKGKAIPRECLNAKENNISFLYIESFFFFSWRLSYLLTIIIKWCCSILYFFIRVATIEFIEFEVDAINSDLIDKTQYPCCICWMYRVSQKKGSLFVEMTRTTLKSIRNWGCFGINAIY